jgi:hypothetical protein
LPVPHGLCSYPQPLVSRVDTIGGWHAFYVPVEKVLVGSCVPA